MMDYSILYQNKFIEENFKSFFSSKGYIEESDVKLTSKVDTSVFLVGSTISVFKPLLLNEKNSGVGHYLVQRAIRTRVLKDLYETNSKSEWSSFFTAIGILTSYNNLNNLVKDVFDFLIIGLKIPTSSLLIRVNSNDFEFTKTLQRYKSVLLIESDSKPINYYKHNYGLSNQGIYGRNFNIAIKDQKTSLFCDIGNIIIIEDSVKKYGIEFAAGISAILSRLNGHNHTVKSSLIASLLQINTDFEYKFADCLSVVANLLYEDTFPNSSNMQGRILKKYITGMFYYSILLKYSVNDICQLINNYIFIEYSTKIDFSERIIKFYNGYTNKS